MKLISAFSLLMVFSIMLSGCSMLPKNSALPTSETEVRTEGDVQVSAPAEVVDPETGEVDQAMFEESQQTSEDDGLGTIETEVNSTVILEENFSDL